MPCSCSAASDDVTFPAIGDVVPHAGRMRLLDRIVAFDGESLTAEVTIRADSPFAHPEGVGAWVGIEYMAQAIAAFAGTDARQRGAARAHRISARTRHYACSVPYFPVGAVLRVSVRRESREDNGFGSFTCAIAGPDITADAIVTVIQPDRPGHLPGQIESEKNA